MKWALKWTSIFFLPNPIFIGEHLHRGAMLIPAPHMHDLHSPGTPILGAGQGPATVEMGSEVHEIGKYYSSRANGPISVHIPV